MDVKKLTGLSYTEFKDLTVLEQIVLLEYLKQKKDEETIISDLVAEQTEKLDKDLKNTNDIEDLPSFNIGDMYKNEGF